MISTETTIELEERTARAKREVLADVASGVVPATVQTFSELHDYVDANGYGGAFDDDAPGADSEIWNALQDTSTHGSGRRDGKDGSGDRMKNHPKTKRTGHAAPRKRQERPAPAETAQKATAAKRARRTASPQAPPRESKRAAVLLLLQREGGVSSTRSWPPPDGNAIPAVDSLASCAARAATKSPPPPARTGVRMYTAK